MESTKVVQALASLAQVTRLEIYRLLVSRGPEGFSAGELVERLTIPGPTLSFHLKALANAELITARKESRFIYYAANFSQMNELVTYLTQNCCSLGAVCDPVCSPGKYLRPKKSA